MNVCMLSALLRASHVHYVYCRRQMNRVTSLLSLFSLSVCSLPLSVHNHFSTLLSLLLSSLSFSLLFLPLSQSRMILSRVTNDPYPFRQMNLLFLPYLSLLLNAYMNGQLFPQYPVALAYLGIIFLVYASFVVVTINQICDFLHIRCFIITTKRRVD